jgi:hypothetical protein
MEADCGRECSSASVEAEFDDLAEKLPKRELDGEL